MDLLIYMVVAFGLWFVGFVALIVVVGVLLWKSGDRGGGHGPGGGFTGGGSAGF
ncbi:hypothetical protein ABZ318_01195 [Streptomyces sp. NPDC006197]|uniref:hypothetical protein n=1 Tax=Streptomyces sp. NPDC006197 TaxID=3156685 RepID=UPI0033A9BFDD